MKTKVTEMLGIEVPIIQGGLGRLGYSELAAAVSNAGGLGQITGMSLPSPEHLRDEIRKTKELTNKPFGVCISLGRFGQDFKGYVEAVLEEGITAVSITGVNQKPVMDMLAGTKVTKLVLVASVRQAKNAEANGADIIMAVGNEGGGVIGKDEVGTIALVPRVVDSVTIPVVAGGGIADGRGFLAALALGAEGIEMGTRFAATKECSLAHENYRKLLVELTERDTVVIQKSIGVPLRALKTEATENILALEKQNVGVEGLKIFTDREANSQAAVYGRTEKGFLAAGQGVGMIYDIPSVSELFERIMKDVNKYYSKISQSLG